MDTINEYISEGSNFFKSIEAPAGVKEFPSKTVSTMKPYVQDIKTHLADDVEKYRVQYDEDLYKYSNQVNTQYTQQVSLFRQNEKEIFTALPVAIFIPAIGTLQ